MSPPKKRQRKKKTVQSPKPIHKVKEPSPYDDWLEEEPIMMTENHKTTKEDEPKKKSAKELDAADIQPAQAQRNALEPVDKSDVRSFQTGTPDHPEGREMLSKEEARAKGFHWLDTDDEDEKAKAKKG